MSRIRRQPIPFRAYLKSIGSDADAAATLGVSVRRVRSWRHRERVPRTRDIPELIRRSGGALTAESFFTAEEEAPANADLHLPRKPGGKTRKAEETDGPTNAEF